MKTYAISCALGLMLSLGVQAQRIVFEKNLVNAGSTLWKRPITAVFKFTNKDREPLLVREVDAGCGCLTPQWPANSIMKGEGGEIRITYDAKQLGHFDRYIDVYTNSSEKPVRIRMKALVSNKESSAIEEFFPCRIDDILMSTNNVEFTDVNVGDSTTVEIELLNQSNDVYTPQLMHLPAYITAEYMPEMIARGRRGKIVLTLHSDKLPDLGLNQTSIYLARFSGDKVGTDNEIAVSAVLLPDLHFAQEFDKKPHFHISATELSMGKLGKKSKVKGYVKISNKGDGVLKLSKIQAFNRAISVAINKTELQPNEEVKMDITIDTHFLGMSKTQPRVLIISNDPTHPKEVVTVNFEK